MYKTQNRLQFAYGNNEVDVPVFRSSFRLLLTTHPNAKIYNCKLLIWNGRVLEIKDRGDHVRGTKDIFRGQKRLLIKIIRGGRTSF